MHEAVALYASLRLLGGRLRGASCVAYTIADPPEEIRSELRRLDVDVRRAETVDPRCPNGNKIVTLNDDDDDFEWLLALDSDVVFAGDLHDYVVGAESVRGKP